MSYELRRLLASIDFRFVHVVTGAPPGFGRFRPAEDVRTPAELVAHLCDLLDLVARPFDLLESDVNEEGLEHTPAEVFEGQPLSAVEEREPGTFHFECARMRAKLRRLDAHLALTATLAPPPEQLPQPLAETPLESTHHESAPASPPEGQRGGPGSITPERDLGILLQGPISDILTHIGQLALLRRLAGSPIERVSYLRAEMPAPATRSL